ncbi:MAG: outer membrane lipoprotein-sorting protein [candidate division WOR-3 bacterium]
MWLFLLLCLTPPDTVKILDRIRENLRYETSQFTAQIEIKKGKRVLTKSFTGFSRGNDFYIEFTNPEDKGVKYLRLKKDLYIYLPDIDDVVRMSGDMLKQSFMGSDLSYEDLMQEDPLKYYKVTSLSDTIIEGSTYTILELLDTTATAPYYRVRMIVDVDRYIWLKEELYTKSGRKIKELEALNYRKIKGKLYPVETIIRDLRIKDSYTKFILKDVDFEIAVPANLFRIESLKR